jgi:hypothetical protein
MGTTERLLGFWMRSVALCLVLCGVLQAAILIALVFHLRSPHRIDERLIGSWQSDPDRTIAALRDHRSVDDNQEAALRKLFGKLRVTYTSTTYTTELDDVTESHQYEVLGVDKHSVVIREVNRKPSPVDTIFDPTEFTVIQFEGPDSYWLYSRIGCLRECFKRIKER